MMNIFHHHLDIGMKPFFEWDMEVLPFAANWFDRALTCDWIDEAQVGVCKVSVTYQLIHTMSDVFDSDILPFIHPLHQHNNGSATEEQKGQRVESSGSRDSWRGMEKNDRERKR